MNIFKAKWGVFLSAIILPLSAFAQSVVPMGSSALNLFTPPPGDQSVRFLQWIFGVVPGVLSGYGNQLIGLLFSVFNAAGVAILGALVVISIYHGVVDLAIKGDFLSGERDKKSIYTIIKIVVATALIVPAKTTGYSLAQSGVMWVVLQGIGLADQVNNKLYTYYAAGGATFTASAPTFEDVKPLIQPMSGMLASQVCVNKIEAIRNKAQQELAAAGGNSSVIPTATPTGSNSALQVFSAARTATFGQVTSSDNSTTPTGQCGSVTWKQPSDDLIQKRLQGHTFTQDGYGNYFADGQKVASSWSEFRSSTYYPSFSSQADKGVDAKTILSYEEAATIQAAMSLEPTARSIVENSGSKATLDTMAQSIGSSIAGAALTYSTIIDPVRQSSGASLSSQMSNMLAGFAQKGWIYTPMMIYTTAFKQSKTLNIEDFAPQSSPPDVSGQGAGFSDLSDADKAELGELVKNVMTGGYNNYASDFMTTLNASNAGQPIDFESFTHEQGATTGNINTVTSYITDTLGGAVSAVNALNKAPTFLAQGAGYAVGAAGAVGSGLSSASNAVVGGVTGLFGKKKSGSFSTKPVSNLQSSLMNYDGTLGGLGGAQDFITGMLNTTIGDVKGLVQAAKAGGFNDQLASLTLKVGPAGPILALLMTSVIGQNIIMLQDYVNSIFSGEITETPDAMGMAMRMGGKMTEASLKSVFIAGEIAMIITGTAKLAGAAGKGAAGLLGSIPLVGSGLGAVAGAAAQVVTMITDLIAQSVQTAVIFYMGFAMIFFTGGLMLYYFLPMVPILNFLLVVASWFGMVMMSMLGAPIFCINLIRTEGQGSMLGKGERYMIDLLRTAIVPSIATIGAVAFIILFNVVFILMSSMVAAFVPIISQAYLSAYLISVVLGVTLIGFAMLTLWVADSLAKACLSTAVNTIGSMMGEALQHIHGESGSQQMGEAIKGAGGQIGGSFGQQGIGGSTVKSAGEAMGGAGKGGGGKGGGKGE